MVSYSALCLPHLPVLVRSIPVVRACISAGHLFRVRVASTFGLLLEGLLIHQVCYGSVGFQSYGVVKHAQRVLGTVMGGYFPKS